MRLLLLMDDTIARALCAEYFALHGFAVDTVANLEDAEPLARFVPYALLVADCVQDGPGHQGALRLARLARRRNDAVIPVLLTTAAEVPEVEPSMRVLTKPQPLATLLDWIREAASEQITRERHAASAQDLTVR